MTKYGVVDLGSNSIRLVIYEVDGKAVRAAMRKAAKAARTSQGRPAKVVAKGDFSTLLDEKKMAGLSSYVEDGVLSKAGIEVASEVLGAHLRRARNVGCTKVGVFATAVLRNCANSKEAVASVQKAVGVRMQVISGAEEAHLDFVGASCDRDLEDGVLVDIGGGSTELARIREHRDHDCVSIPQGSVSSYARFVRLVLPTEQEEAAVEDAFLAKLREAVEVGRYAAADMFGVGGSVRAAAKMQKAIDGLEKVPKRLLRSQVEGQLDLLKSDASAFAHLAAQAVPDRMHTVCCGSVILRVLMRVLGVERLEVCRYGVREGFLIKHMLERA